MASEVIPVVDLRLLSQEELNALSLTSPKAFDLRRCDDVVVPKIDRSVFNESAGSRKQTYSRLRLAPRKPGAPPSSSSSAAASSAADPCRRENQKIVSFLRKLFSGEEPASSPPSPPPQPQPETLTLTLGPTNKASAPEVDRGEEKVSSSNALVLVDDREKEVLNAKGLAVDLIALAGKEAPFGEELMRRTQGMKTEDELLGFLGGLEGLWGSRRKKRKIVDAEVFGDDLPRGWKLLLGLRRKEGVARLDCRRYVSPNGKQFVSCKDIALYMLSLLGHQDSRQLIPCQNGTGTSSLDKLTPGYVAGPTCQADISGETPTSSSVVSSIYADHEKQDALFRVEKQDMIELKNILGCHKCNLTFSDKDALVQHLLYFHQSVKRRRLGKSIGDGVIMKDGKYECQFCHKTFSERHRYNGHIGAHVRYQGLSAEALPDAITTTTIINPTPLAAVPISALNVLADKNDEFCTAKSVECLHVDSSNCRVEMEKHEIDPKVNGSAETSEAICTSMAFDGCINNCDVTHGLTEEIVEACNITGVKDNACVGAIFPSVTDVHSAAQDFSPKFSQASISKNVDNHTSDIDMNDNKFEEVVEDYSMKDIKSDEFLIAKSPSSTNVDITNSETINESSHCSSMSQSIADIDDRTSDSDMNFCKSEAIVDDSNVKDIKHGEFLNAKSPPTADVDIATCETINGNGLCSSLNQSIADIDVCDMIGYKSDGIVDISNAATGVEPNSCLDALSPSLINLDGMAHTSGNDIDLSSCTMISRMEKYNEEHKVEVENDVLIISSNGSNYGVENYSNDIFTSTLEASELVKMDTSSNDLRNNPGICHVLSNKDVQSAMHDEFHTSCVTPFDREHTSGMRTSADCVPHSFTKVSMVEEMNKPGNVLENCFHGRDAVDDSSDFMGNAGRNPVNVNMIASSWLQSSGSLSLLDMIPDQCGDELSGVGRQHENLSELQELRFDGAQPFEFVLLAGQESGSAAPIPADEFDYVAELEAEHHRRPSAESEWEASLVDRCEPIAVCMWCGNELIRDRTTAELESGMDGFMCSACKQKISGQLDAADLAG